MKKLALIAIGVVFSLSSFAQDGKYGATPEDSIKCIESLIYKDYLKGDPKLAHSLWRVAYKTCPKSQKSLYINGVKIYKNLAKDTKDAALQKAYLDTMFSIYDQRIEMFGQKGAVLGMKGQTMLATKQDKEATYAILEEAVGLTGDKTQSGTLVATMFAIINLEKAEKKTVEEVVAMFEKTMAICAANADGKRADRYAKAQQKIQNVTSSYLTCEIIVPLAEKNFEANKENVDWLRRTVRLLKSKKCYQTPEDAAVFAKVAEAYFGFEPSASGAEGIGLVFLSKKNYSKAIEFFGKAVEMAENNEDKAEYNLNIAKANLYAKSYAAARTYAKKAAALKSGWGEPYMVIGDAYMAGASSCDDGKLGKYAAYWAAVDKYQKAKSIDSSVASSASKKIARASISYPANKDLFFYSVKDGDAYTCGCWINESTTVRSKK